jgi:hypothetical protein
MLAGQAYNDAGDSGGDIQSFAPSYVERITGERTDMIPANGFNRSAVHALNNNGIAAGMSSPLIDSYGLITTWNSRTGQVLQTFPEFGFSEVFAMNDRGDFVGRPESGNRSFTYVGGTRRVFESMGLKDINGLGETVGNDTAGPIWMDASGNRSYLPILYGISFPERINDSRTIIGQSGEFGSNGARKPTLWTGGQVYDFNSLCNLSAGDSIKSLIDINNRGQVIGYGKFNGVEGTFIATPVPEPATLAALSLGAAVLLRRRRK